MMEKGERTKTRVTAGISWHQSSRIHRRGTTTMENTKVLCFIESRLQFFEDNRYNCLVKEILQNCRHYNFNYSYNYIIRLHLHKL